MTDHDKARKTVALLRDAADRAAYEPHLHHVAADQLSASIERCERLEALAAEVADDLAAEIDAKYGIGTAPPEAFHPATMRQHARDMEPVMRLRAALANDGRA